MDTSADDGPTLAGSPESVAPEPDGGRESGIVEVERKASAVTGGVTGALASTLTNTTSDRLPTPVESGQREHDIEIDTELGEGHAPRAQMITQTVVSTGASASALDRTALDLTALEDDLIQVSDDEIESAEPARPTLTSGRPGVTGTPPSSRPPSSRSGPPSSALPPPRRSSRTGALLRSSLPPPSYPSLSPAERNPWALANKTLELSRANARISYLEDQVAFRDARILTLEERLAAAQLKIEELERKRDGLPVAAVPSSTPVAARSAAPVAASSAAPVAASSAAPAAASVAANGPASSLLGAPVARASSKPAIAIPKPADIAKATEAKPALARSNGKHETGREEEAAHALPPAGASEPANGSLAAAAHAQRATDVALPNGSEDLSRIAAIGTRFEAALRKQGITSVHQIAAWSDADVRQVAKALKIPKSRIVKGRWIEAAREMIGSRSTSE